MSETRSNWTETHCSAGTCFFHYKCVPKLNRELFCICQRRFTLIQTGPNREFFFQYQAGLGQISKEKSGRSVVIFVRVFPDTLFTLGCFRICRVYTRCFGLPEMWVTRYLMIFKANQGWISYRKKCRVSSKRWALVTNNSLPL